ncbi:bifunctional glycosyltransferase family 2/GtrA family protein [bacterium]|nr:bifunctional glycosyltransferase family 2/GtrA family protein [bacterium]
MNDSKIASFSVVLPCYNEGQNIPLILERFQPFAKKINLELILVDNGSTDDSYKYFQEELSKEENSFARLVKISKNIGYGHGIHEGLLQAKGQVLAYSHADIQTPPEDLYKGYSKILNGEVDLNDGILKGFRPGRDEALILTSGLKKFVSLMLGYNFVDINAQPKIFSRSFFESLKLQPEDFSYDCFILFQARRKNFAIHSMDVQFDARIYGESKWAANIVTKYRTIFYYLKSILTLAWQYRKDCNSPLGQLLRFTQIGIFTNIVNYSIFLICLWFFFWSPKMSSSIAFSFGLLSSFFFNKSYTFKNTHKVEIKLIIKFLMINTCSFIANYSTVHLGVTQMGFSAELVQFAAILMAAIVNFLGYKLFVFPIHKDL